MWTASATGSGSHDRALEGLQRSGLDGADAAELFHQAGLAGGAEAGDAVEDRRRHALAAELAVVRDGEAVGLVADALEQVEGIAPPRHPHRIGGTGPVHLLELLGQRRHGDLLVEAELLEHPDGDPELPLAAVDEQQLRRVREAATALGDRLVTVLDVGAQAPGQHLLHGGEVVVALRALDLETAVLALLGETVLEHHHRADVVAALDVAHVVALDPQRGLGQVEVLLQLVERTSPGVVIGRPAQTMPIEFLLGVAGDHGHQLTLVTPLGHPDRHLRAALQRQPLLVELGVGALHRHQHLLGDARGWRVGVEALEDPVDQLGRGEVLGLVDHEALAPQHAPTAHEEDLDGRFELVVGEPDDVDVLVLLDDHLLLLAGPLHRAEAVADACRPFELELGRRLSHLDFETTDHPVGVAGQEGDELVDELVVGLLGDLTDAGAGALLDVEQQAGAAEPFVAPELVRRAGAHREGAQEEVEGVADGPGVGVRAEVARALALRSTHDRGAGPLVVQGDGQERVALVVAQADVEPRLVLLDEAVLEHERLDVVADLDPLDGLRRGHHLGGAGGQVPGVLEVVRQALAEALGLAHVDDPPVGILELVGARRVGDRARGRSLDHRAIVRSGTPGSTP